MTLIGNPNHPRRILVGVDDSETSDLALTRACEIATAQENRELHVLRAIVPPVAPYLVLGASSITEARTALGQRADAALAAVLARQPERKPGARIVCHVLVDEPAHAIAQAATDMGADLVLVGTHGRRAVARFFLGSVAEAVVRLAPCPVLVVRPKADQAVSNVTSRAAAP